jgi:hypothetical protein
VLFLLILFAPFSDPLYFGFAALVARGAKGFQTFSEQAADYSIPPLPLGFIKGVVCGADQRFHECPGLGKNCGGAEA